MMTKIFLTLYVIYAFVWLLLLPAIQFGMGPGNPHHDWWRKFVDKMMGLVIGLAAVTGFVHILILIWR